MTSGDGLPRGITVRSNVVNYNNTNKNTSVGNSAVNCGNFVLV